MKFIVTKKEKEWKVIQKLVLPNAGCKSKTRRYETHKKWLACLYTVKRSKPELP